MNKSIANIIHHPSFCALACGLTLLGYMGYRAIKWLLIDRHCLSSLFKKNIATQPQSTTQTNESPTVTTTLRATPTTTSRTISIKPKLKREKLFAVNITDKITSRNIIEYIASFLPFREIGSGQRISRQFRACFASFQLYSVEKGRKQILKDSDIIILKNLYRKIIPINSIDVCHQLEELELRVTGEKVFPILNIQFFASVKKLSLLSHATTDKILEKIIQNLVHLQYLKLGSPLYYGRGGYFTAKDFVAIAQSKSLSHLSVKYTTFQGLPRFKLNHLKIIELWIEISGFSSHVNERYQYNINVAGVYALKRMPADKTLHLNNSSCLFSKQDEDFLLLLLTDLGPYIHTLSYPSQIASSEPILRLLSHSPLTHCRTISLHNVLLTKNNINPFLNTFPQLNALSLSKIEIDNLFNIKNLKKLSLQNVKVPEGFWKEFLSKFPQELHQLSLRYMELQEEELIPILEKGRFTELDLSSTSITDTTLAIISENQPNLIRLNLFDTKITSEGLSMLSGLSKLQEVIISRHNYTSSGWDWDDKLEYPKGLKLESFRDEFYYCKYPA